MKEEVVELNVKDISDFPKHPFKINNDLNYEELKNSIIESGVLVPTIVRKKEDGKYADDGAHDQQGQILTHGPGPLPPPAFAAPPFCGRPGRRHTIPRAGPPRPASRRR